MGKKLNLKWVTDVIGDEYKSWHKGDVVLLQAQTGTGKTYFVKNKLIDYLLPSEKLLYVCNRVDLKRQLKKDLLIKYNQPIPMIKDTDETDLEKLDSMTMFGNNNNIIITSYHAVQNSSLDELYGDGVNYLNYFDYIICDEIHYILTDSNFNNKCRFAYNTFIKTYFRCQIKIFISATMEEIEEPIHNNIDMIMGEKPKIHKYETGTDYSYVNCKYIDNNLDTLINLIKNDSSNEKWMIFVTSKKEGNYLHGHLGDKLSSTIYAGLENTDNKELTNIINHSKFNKKVLICTKVLDNGINIEDDDLTNIVIMAWDRITFLQELGRKRIDINNAPDINLYIFKRFKKSFASKKFQCIKDLEEVKLLSENENAFNKKYDNDIKKLGRLNYLIYRNNSKGKWDINQIGLQRCRLDLEYYEKIEAKFNKNGKYSFIKEQLKWLGLSKSFSKMNEIDEVILNEKVLTLEEYLENMFNSGEVMLMKEDRQDLIEHIGLIDYNHSNIKNEDIKYIKSYKTINSYLLEDLKLNYQIKEFPTSRIINYGNKNKKKNYNYAWKIIPA